MGAGEDCANDEIARGVLLAAEAMREAYRFLRQLENRLQMLRDAQTHVLPEAPLDRLAEIHDDHTVAQQPHHAQIMRHEQIAHAHRLFQVVQQV